MKPDPSAIVSAFRIRGTCVSAEPYGSGHINDTYLVTCEDAGERCRYILQHINGNIFKNIPAMMDNITRVTGHQRSKLEKAGAADVERRALTLVPAKTGLHYHSDENGAIWRMYHFIEGSRVYDTVEDRRQAYEAAKAFGEFQCELSDLPDHLHQTMPDFHNGRKRFEAFLGAAAGDACGRAASVKKEIDFVLSREAMTDVVVDLLASGELPERVTHNDTKLNNVLFDVTTGKGLCVIDLDIVMPGTVLYDFGDMVRTATSTADEDETDLGKMEMDITLFEALAQGYLESTSGFLTTRERELLPFSGKLITFIIGMRFLADYLHGDRYFRTRRDGHNLDRARTQFKLVESMERQMGEMERCFRG